MFWAEWFSCEDKKAAEELFNNFPGFDIKAGMDRRDFVEGKLDCRQWQILAPSLGKIWCTGTGITFADAYRSLLGRIKEWDDKESTGY